MRSFVCEPMQHGHLFLAGDAAHIVPPTGAKGMNLALADVAVLARALADWFAPKRPGRPRRLLGHAASGRVWRVQDFSNTMTELLHLLPGERPVRRSGPAGQAALPSRPRAAMRTDHRRELRGAADRLTRRAAVRGTCRDPRPVTGPRWWTLPQADAAQDPGAVVDDRRLVEVGAQLVAPAPGGRCPPPT